MTEDIRIRTMTVADYEKVKALWMTIQGFGIRTIDDSREGVERFIRRNPDTSVVAEKDGEIIGTILCGHDGRSACFYHVCVRADLRRQGIGKAMAVAAMRRLQPEHINKVSLVAYKRNEVGNQFWNKAGWVLREDLNTYDFVLNDQNITQFNEG
ncbi:MAG: GNAT family N-acetyltransferase [Eubacterium sp.]|nr:GNAT family N-acetyltransferase [Eubacterium sp.]